MVLREMEGTFQQAVLQLQNQYNTNSDRLPVLGLSGASLGGAAADLNLPLLPGAMAAAAGGMLNAEEPEDDMEFEEEEEEEEEDDSLQLSNAELSGLGQSSIDMDMSIGNWT